MAPTYYRGKLRPHHRWHRRRVADLRRVTDSGSLETPDCSGWFDRKTRVFWTERVVGLTEKNGWFDRKLGTSKMTILPSITTFSGNAPTRHLYLDTLYTRQLLWVFSFEGRGKKLD